MQQKILLINSMEKLINHIVVSKKNQEEIFASLSKNDFKKIISNLEDDNQKLRKISLLLISQLLYANQALKQKFCGIMNIPTVPGRVALNTKLCPASSKTRNTVTVDMSRNIKEVYTLIKQPLSDNEKQSLFWFINFEGNSRLQLQQMSSSNPQSLQIQDILDPVDSMVGFVLSEKSVQKKYEPPVGSQARRKSDYEPAARMVNNYFKPGGFKQEGYRTNTSNNNNAVLNHSMNVTPGYSTDRQVGYIPKTIHTGVKPANTSMYQDSKYQFNKSINTANSPPLHQIKNTALESEPKSKYTGIKVISNAPTTAKGREGYKYFEENPLFQGSNTNKNSSNPTGINTSLGSRMGTGRVERGYETLREKKIVEKYTAN